MRRVKELVHHTNNVIAIIMGEDAVYEYVRMIIAMYIGTMTDHHRLDS